MSKRDKIVGIKSIFCKEMIIYSVNCKVIVKVPMTRNFIQYYTSVTSSKELCNCVFAEIFNIIGNANRQRVTLHCILTFKKVHLFKSSDTMTHKRGGLVINHSLRTCKCSFSYIFYCYMLQNKQAYTHSLYAVSCHTLYSLHIQ